MTTSLSLSPMARPQSGVTLLIALVFLLIITVLGISSMRGVALESRITANLKQEKNLMNSAEAGLRIGEGCILTDLGCPTAITGELPSTADSTAIDTAVLFTAANASTVATITTGYDTKIQWYYVMLGPLDLSQNDCAAREDCGRYYEINVCASTVLCTSDTTTQRVILRSVVAH